MQDGQTSLLNAEVVEWQTRTFEGRVAQAVRVQVPPSAPRLFSGYPAIRRTKPLPLSHRRRPPNSPRIETELNILEKGKFHDGSDDTA